MDKANEGASGQHQVRIVEGKGCFIFSVRGFGARLGSFGRSCGVVLRALGTILGALGGHFGSLGGHFGDPWGSWGLFFAPSFKKPPSL